MNKKGFTLIELLAVISIIAIIALITTPIVMNVVSKSQTNADLRSVENYVKAVDIYAAEAETDANMKNNVNQNLFSILEIDGKKATSGQLYFNAQGETYVAVVLNNKCYVKDFNQSIDNISISDDIENCGGEPLVQPDDSCFNYTVLEDGTISIDSYTCGNDYSKITSVTVKTGMEEKAANFTRLFLNAQDITYTFDDVLAFVNGGKIGEMTLVDMFKIGEETLFLSNLFNIEYSEQGLTSIIIPSSINNYTVTRINSVCFYGVGLKKVALPSTLTTIGGGAFTGNNLETINIPSSVKTIEAAAFTLNNLTSVVFNSNLYSLGSGVFNGNNIPDDQAMFYAMNSETGEDRSTLISYGGSSTTVTIPSNVITLDDGVFTYSLVENIIVPENVQNIGNSSFDTMNLKSIIIKGKTSASDFTSYSTIASGAGWAYGYSDDNIIWNG